MQKLAIVSIVIQDFCNIYDPCKGLKRGTIFADLDLPFLAPYQGGKCNG